MTVARHIVHVVRSDGFAGVERYIADTAGELARRGHRVEVVGGSAGRMRDELPAEVRHHRGDSSAQALRALSRIGRCDVVHAHMTAAEAVAALLRRRNGGIFVTTRHFAGRRGATLFGRTAAPVVRARLDRQIAISEFVAASLGEPSVVIPNGVPARTGAPVERARTVLVLQRLEPEKSTALGLRAWARSGLADHGWRLVVFGRGSEEPALRALADDLAVADSVDFAGVTRHPREALAGCAMLLATPPAEPFGLAVVEAMAEGTPVVAADGGAHRETLGAEGALFTPGDVDGCVRQLKSLAASREVRDHIGRALHERWAARFTIERHVDALVDCYLDTR